MAARASKKAHNALKLLVNGSILKLHCIDLKVQPKTKRFLVFAISKDKKSIAKLYFDTVCPPLPYQM